VQLVLGPLTLAREAHHPEPVTKVRCVMAARRYFPRWAASTKDRPWLRSQTTNEKPSAAPTERCAKLCEIAKSCWSGHGRC